MPSLKHIRKRISSVRSTQQITKAMKMVAAARLRRAQEAIEAKRPYAARLKEMIAELAARADLSDHPLLAQREPRAVEVLVFTSDRGLCGGFNTTVNRVAERYVKKNERGHQSIGIDIIGRKGHEYFRRRQANIGRYFREVLTQVSLEKAAEIAEHAMVRFREGNLDAIYCVYNQFKSAISQEVVVDQLLPVIPAAEAPSPHGVDIIFEPSKRAIMDAVLPRHVTVQVYRMLLESVASEMGARMSAMDAATKNAGELIDKLTLQYNRARQANITTELMEIIGGAEALKG
jgi:F-type H+-transporting ATPase subunit gamma